MAKEFIAVGSASIKQRISIVSASTGLALTGIVFNSSGLAANFMRDGDTGFTAITLVTAAVGTFTSSGFKEVGHGVYEIGLPNTVWANSVRDAIVVIDGFSGMLPVYLEFQLQNPVGTIVTTNNDKTGYALTTAPPTAAAIAALILATPANLLATDTSGRVTLIPADVPPTTAAIATAVAAAILISPTHLIATDSSGNVSVAGSFPTVAAIAAAILDTPTIPLVTDGAGHIIGAYILGPVGSVAGSIGGSLAGSVGGSVEGSVGSIVDLTDLAAAVAAVILATPANLISTNADGTVNTTITGALALDMTQVVPLVNTAQTLGDALNAARAQGFGGWEIDGTTLKLFAADGVTIVRTFTLNSAVAPTSRV